MGTLQQWSSRYDWPARAEAYDAQLEEQKNAHAQEIMRSGLALGHERVTKLKLLADFLEQELYTRDETGAYSNLWLPDVKQIGAGDDAQRVDIVRFNTPLVEQYRGVLDDLAKETGGRKQTHDITSDGQKIAVIVGGIDLETDV
jgi:hypothetical protein